MRRIALRETWRSVTIGLVLVLGMLAGLCRPASAASLGEEAPSDVIKRACVPGAARLCVDGNRFEVTAAWKTRNGQSGTGKAVALTANTGYFWFFSSSNAEVVVKVLDACRINQRFWFFAGGLSNVQVDLTVRDTTTGAVKTYHNPQGAAFRPIQDTRAFSGCPRTMESESAAVGVPSGTTLSLRQNRFKVSAAWRTRAGQSGVGQAVKLTEETGYFWFFGATNVEMVLKILDGCALGNNFWVFAGGLTDVEVDVTVTDTVTGVAKTYRNPQGVAFQPIQDTAALTCSADGLPPDPGPAGKLTLAGIDSDHDGLRDDLQRYIVLNYRSSPQTVDALVKTAKIVQGSILDSASPTDSIDHATDLARTSECLQALRPGDARQVEAALVAEALNTEDRGLAYLAFNDKLGGAAFPLSPPVQWAASCGVPTTAELRVFGSAAHGAAVTSCTQSSKATVFFGNGVWNTCPEAQVSTVYLAAALTPLLSPEEQGTVSFATACNPTQGTLADLWRAYKQSISSNFSGFWRALAGLDIVPESFKQLFLAASGRISAAAAVDDPTLQSHINLYQSLLLEGQKVVVTAHSQGNFYANLASDSLSTEEQKSFGIVSVGNPDNRVAANHVNESQPYTTFSNDLVIGAIRPVTGALPSNAGLSTNIFTDWTSHKFVDSYMAPGATSRGRILSHIHTLLQQLPSPTNPAGNGVITVTLTWDHATDVDLHVFEPGGSHVYYQNLTGTSGFLDRDNVTGFGPEHYYVACDNLQPGTYQVGVNYYNGDVFPEGAHIQVAAGFLSRSFTIQLPVDRGSSGNSSPIPIADIVVTGSAATGFNFEVRPR
jgi:hypothetical protein